MVRLPQPGGDQGKWGEILNAYLLQSHSETGTLKADTVDSSQLKSNAVTTSAITDASVTAPKLANNAVTLEKIAGLGVNGGIATLDGGGKLSEAQIPTYLSNTQLGPYINSVVSTSPSVYRSSFPEMFGAKPARRSMDIVTTDGQAQITSATAQFSSADVGSLIVFSPPTPQDYAFCTTIASVSSSTTAVLATAAPFSGSGQYAWLGIDNATPIQTWCGYTNMLNNNGVLSLSPGATYLISSGFVMSGGLKRLIGNGATIMAAAPMAVMFNTNVAHRFRNVVIDDLTLDGSRLAAIGVYARTFLTWAWRESRVLNIMVDYVRMGDPASTLVSNDAIFDGLATDTTILKDSVSHPLAEIDYADGTGTSGSTTFSSATANFTVDDVGRYLLALTPTGTAFGVHTLAKIVTVSSASTVVLDALLTVTSSTIAFRRARRSLYLGNVTDSKVRSLSPVASDISVHISQSAGNTILHGVHSYGHGLAQTPRVSFLDEAGSEFIATYADTPLVTGYWIRASSARLISANIYNNSAYGTDNQMVGIRIDSGTTTHVIITPKFKGQNSSRRLAVDIDGDLAQSTVIGAQVRDVVVTNSILDRFPNQKLQRRQTRIVATGAHTYASFDARAADYFVLFLNDYASGNPSISNGTQGQTVRLMVQQDSTGGRTWAFPSNARMMPGNPSVSTAGGTSTFTDFTYNATSSIWQQSAALLTGIPVS